jgi:hypothetical protein
MKRGLLTADTRGLTAGYGVIVRADCANNLRLLAHEFVHVAQYERLEREGFLQEYIQQMPHTDTRNASLELEAEAKASNAMPRRPISETQAGSPPRRAIERVVAVMSVWSIRPTSGEAPVARSKGFGPERSLKKLFLKRRKCHYNQHRLRG